MLIPVKHRKSSLPSASCVDSPFPFHVLYSSICMPSQIGKIEGGIFLFPFNLFIQSINLLDCFLNFLFLFPEN